MSVNRVIIVGNMGKQVFTAGSAENPIANFSVATNQRWKDKATGEMNQSTEWHRLVAFGRDAKYVSAYAGEGGRLVHIEGRLQTRKFTPAGGVEKSATEIVVEAFQFLDRAVREGAPASDSRTERAPAAAAAVAPSVAAQERAPLIPPAAPPILTPAAQAVAALDNDIPF